MDYIQFLTIMATMVGGFGFIYKELKNKFKSFENEIREDIRIQSARSDKLYEMFIDLLKSRRDV